MIRHALAVALAVAALAGSVRAQEAAPPLAPHQVEVTRPPVPVQMLAPDAHALATRLGSAARAAQPPRAPRAAGGGSRTIMLPRPEVTNPGSDFLFRDATDRTPKVSVEASLEQR